MNILDEATNDAGANSASDADVAAVDNAVSGTADVALPASEIAGADDGGLAALQEELNDADLALVAAGIEESEVPIAESIAVLAAQRDAAVAESKALLEANEALTKKLADAKPVAGKKAAKASSARAFELPTGKDVVTAAEAAGTGESKIAFADGDGVEFTDLPALTFGPQDYDINESDGTALLKAPIAFPPGTKACELQSVWLLDEKGKVAGTAGWRVPLSVGGGRSAEVPANTLKFG